MIYKTFLFLLPGIIFVQSDLSSEDLSGLESQIIQCIIGGVCTNIDKVPYIVSLQSWYFEKHECGGSIIGEDQDDKTWVVTAAHCTEGRSNSYVRVGSAMHGSGGTIFNVSEVISHPKFTRTTMDYDISLLRLDGKITEEHGGKKIILPEQDEPVPNGILVRVSGWGRTNNENESREKLRTVEVDVYDHKQCISNYRQLKYDVTQNMICASGPGKDACQMDSGGPLVYQNKKLVGIVSWGDECGSPLYPGVYTKVSAFRDWIKKHSGI